MIQDAGCNVACDYVQADESTLPVIDNEKRRAVKGYVWSVVNVMTGDRFFFLTLAMIHPTCLHLCTKLLSKARKGDAIHPEKSALFTIY